MYRRSALFPSTGSVVSPVPELLKDLRPSSLASRRSKNALRGDIVKRTAASIHARSFPPRAQHRRRCLGLSSRVMHAVYPASRRKQTQAIALPTLTKADRIRINNVGITKVLGRLLTQLHVESRETASRVETGNSGVRARNFI